MTNSGPASTVTTTPFVCVLSGGQDSTTCLAWALDTYGKHPNSACIFFDYGQRHSVEEEAAHVVAAYFGLPLTKLPVSSIKALGDSSLTDYSRDVTKTDERDGLPTSFTPGRNVVFLSLAAAFAYKLRHETIHLVTGVCQTDYSGYPDCRAYFIRAHEASLALGMNKQVHIHTPLMHLTKAETVKLMEKLGHLDAYKYTHTCYLGQQPPCGTCPACNLRAKGFTEAGISDPLVVA